VLKMGAVKEVSSAAMPYVILGGVVIGAYLMRDKIKDFLAGFIPKNPFVAAGEELAHDSIYWSKRVACLLGNKTACDYVAGNDWLDKNGLPSPIIESGQGFGSPDGSDVNIVLWDLENNAPAGGSIPLVGSGIPPVSGSESSGYQDALAGVSNLVTGSAQEAFENAQAIKAANVYVPPAIKSYLDVAKFDTDKITLVGYKDFSTGGDLTADFINPAGDMALSIEPTGWALLQKDARYAGLNNPEGWRDVQGAGGSSAAVWVDPRLESYLGMAVNW